MKLHFEKKIFLGFFIILTIVVWLSIHSYNYNRKFAAMSILVAHTNEVLFNSAHVLTNIKDIETSQRGYVITGDSTFLSTFKETQDTVFEHLKKLLYLTRDNKVQQVRIQKLKKVMAYKIKLSETIIEARKRGFEEARGMIILNKNRLVMGEINKVVFEIQEEERKLLHGRILEREVNYDNFTNYLTALLVATAVIIIFVFTAIYIGLKAKTEATMALRKASLEIKDLYENAPCGYHSLDADGNFVEMNATMLSWLGYAHNEVIGKLSFFDIISEESKSIFTGNFSKFKKHGFVSGLEFDFVRKDSSIFHGVLNSTVIYNAKGNYVKSRSTVFDITDRRNAELKSQQLNKELEAFTYSVSHDLRSPLRSINGYAKIFLEDYTSKVDEEGVRILNVIVGNATKMGLLIDSLLDFSRVGKKEIIKFPYNATHMVNSLVFELMEYEKGRTINFNIKPLEPAFADVVLIRQVWTNLISNALKYTQKTPLVEIEIGSSKENDQVVYYVKDNGVGFDMLYVNKLFGVFQRLHKSQDFEGTGVGLAIVDRIIGRHGGKVWVDAALNKGATFFFTLPV